MQKIILSRPYYQFEEIPFWSSTFNRSIVQRNQLCAKQTFRHQGMRSEGRTIHVLTHCVNTVCTERSLVSHVGYVSRPRGPHQPNRIQVHRVTNGVTKELQTIPRGCWYCHIVWNFGASVLEHSETFFKITIMKWRNYRAAVNPNSYPWHGFSSPFEM